MNFISKRDVKIRKSRPCTGCSTSLNKGDPAANYAWSDGGTMASATLCIPCQNTLSDEDPDFEWAPGELGDIRNDTMEVRND